MKKKLENELLLYPCPVLLITSKLGNKENVFTVSWSGIACSHPEYITISVKPTRFSYNLICNSGCFTANIINENLLEIADYCRTFSGKNHNKFVECNLTKIPGKMIDVPLILECPIDIECKVEKVLKLGSHHLIVAKVVEKLVDAHISEKSLHEYLNPISYFRPNYYSLNKKILGVSGKVYDKI